MTVTKTVTIYDEDDDIEREVELPACYEVCPDCEGHGSHLTPSIRNHAYSMEEFNDAFYEDDEKEEYFKRGGRYDVVCGTCSGKRVVLVVDERHLSPEQRKDYELWLGQEHDRVQADAECRNERMWEARMLGEY